MRTDRDLVIELLDHIAQVGVRTGLCLEMGQMEKNGELVDHEPTRLKQILIANRPQEVRERKVKLDGYWWESGEEDERFDYLKELIEKLK